MELKRRAEKAGSWYPEDPQELRETLQHLLDRARGLTGRPPALEGDRIPGHIVAGVVPHAGLFYSGGIAARTFHALRETTPNVKTLLLFGAVHTMSLSRPAVWPNGRWQSPLGAVEVDADAAEALCGRGAGADTAPHMGDNALELQIPFIRYCFPDCRIVPIAVPPNLEASTLGRTAATLFQERALAGELAVLASTDLTHYGRCYGYAPAGEGSNGLKWCRENDQRLLRLALDLRHEEIVPQALRDHSACGAGALAAATAFAAHTGCACGELLEYATSHDIHPSSDAGVAVGYASLIFRN